MNDQQPPMRGHSQRTLREYFRILRRRKWIVLQAIVLVPTVAVVLASQQPARFQAKSQVLLTHQSLAQLLTTTQDPNANPQIADRIASTQANLARVPPVLNRALAAVPGAHLTETQFLHSSAVTAGANSDLLTFSVTAATSRLAIALSAAYARAYAAYRHELDTAALRRAQTDVGVRIAELRQNRKANSALEARLVETQQQLQTLATLETSNATVVSLPSSAPQVSPTLVRDGILGAALGVVIGLAFALLIEALDTRIRSGEEVAERLGTALLGRLPVPPKKLRERNRLVMMDQPNGRHSEAVRIVRTNLELANIDRDATLIAIASALPAEGKSTTAANLAIAFARSGRRVAIVDLDLRKPSLATLFEIREPWGVTDVALGHASLETALHPVNVKAFLDDAGDWAADRVPQLDVLVAGQIPPNPGEFVSSRRLSVILAELRAKYDVVLIDTPPMLSVGDALAVSAQVDAFVLVCSLALTRRGILHEFGRALAFVRCPTLGTIITSAPAADSYGYGGGYYGFGDADGLTKEIVRAD